MKTMKLTLTVLIVSFICVSMFLIGEARALPSWNKKLAAVDRFVRVLNKAAVLDKETGLVWEKSPDNTSTYNWEDAITHCAQLNVGDRKGWHLPTVEQLASLVDPTRLNLALPRGNPFQNVLDDVYWSATTNAGLTTSARYVDFYDGEVSYIDKAVNSYAWCVRGGQSHDGQ